LFLYALPEHLQRRSRSILAPWNRRSASLRPLPLLRALSAPEAFAVVKKTFVVQREKVAKEGTGNTITLAGLATLAAPPAESANSCFLSIASSEGEAGPGRPDIPTDWAAGLQGIAGKPCPIAIDPKRWLQLQADANRFVDQWGVQAVALGWSTLDIFGCHPTRPADRYDTMGLVWMIADAEVVALGAEVANLRKAAGTIQRVWKCAVDRGRILPWDL
jgi:hypothetical protein